MSNNIFSLTIEATSCFSLSDRQNLITLACVPCSHDRVNPIACLEVPLTHAQYVSDLYGYRLSRTWLVWMIRRTRATQ